jgi:Sec-independent protein secretion pathway component TatC
VPLIIMYELSIVIARYVNPTTEVTAHNLARTDEDDEEEEFEPEPHEENRNERDL